MIFFNKNRRPPKSRRITASLFETTIAGIMRQTLVAGCRCGGDVHSPKRSARIRLLKKNTTILSKGVIPVFFFYIKTVRGDGGKG